MFEEFPALCVFHDEVETAFGLDYLVKLNYVGMTEFLENVDFASHSL